MATYHAIAATGKAILGLLEDAYPRAEYGPALFELYQSSNFQNPMTAGFSLYLYRVTVNRTKRSMPTRPNINGKLPVAPVAVDLSYMLTTWAGTAEKQQILLGWAMRVLEDTAIMPAALLNHYAPRQDIFRANETVELIAEVLSLQDLSAVWDEMKPKAPLSAPYMARLIELESLRDVREGEFVQTRVFDMASVKQ